MPKQAPTPRRRDGPFSKKDGLEHKQRRKRLPTNSEMKKMSVREKLLAGVSSSFAEPQRQQQQDAPHNQPIYAPVASLQHVLDEAIHMNPKIHRSLDDSPGSGTMMLPGEVEKGLWAEDLAKRRIILSDHFFHRMNQREDTSRRLQAVLRLVNDNPFAPPAEASDEQEPRDRLRLFLQNACRKHGYRKMRIDVCGFMTIKILSDLKGEPLGSVPREPVVEPADSQMLDAQRGGIMLFESDVPDQFGRITTWMWLKLSRPLASYEPRHRPAPDISKEEEAEDEAWVIIAIPKSQIETLEDTWGRYPVPGKETHGDYLMDMSILHAMRQDTQNHQKRKELAFRYSRDGVPSIVTSKKSGNVDSPWFGLRTDIDEMRWEGVHDAMKTNSCLVHVLSAVDADWIHVTPGQSEQLEQREKSAEAQTPRRMKRLGGARKSSNLKNEVL
ncbi:hypothetical protein V8C42DRAFT_360704 [Trichoderma barbatum]